MSIDGVPFRFPATCQPGHLSLQSQCSSATWKCDNVCCLPVQADIILAINEEYGTDYDQEAPWQSLFAEDPNQVCLHPLCLSRPRIAWDALPFSSPARGETYFSWGHPRPLAHSQFLML